MTMRVLIATLAAALLAAVPPAAPEGVRLEDVGDPAIDRAAAVDSLLADPSLPPEFKAHALEQILRGHEEEPWAHRAADALGRLLLGADRNEEAASYLELALEGSPDDADLLNTLGYLYADGNMKLARAEELVRRALAVAPAETPEHVLGYYRDSLGWAFFRQGRLDSALAHLEAANHLAPGTPEIRGHLVELYAELDRTAVASALLVADLVQARGLDPDLRARLRRLYRTTPEGKPLPVELEVERQVLAHAVAEVEAIEAAGGSLVRLEAGDGFPLAATLYRARGKKKAPAAVLVPMFGGERKDLDGLAQALAAAGISALTLDPRGHGGSVNAEIFAVRIFADDMPGFVHGALLDVAAALGFAHDLAGQEPVALIGASLGGMVAALAAEDAADVKALVLLSPGPATPFTAAVTRDRRRPTLIVAGAEDATAMSGAEAMIAGLDRTRSEVRVYPGADHGTALLAAHQDLGPRIVRWLAGAFKDARGL